MLRSELQESCGRVFGARAEGRAEDGYAKIPIALEATHLQAQNRLNPTSNEPKP